MALQVMTKKKRVVFCADFETTVYPGQEETEVWSACIAPLGSTDPNECYIYHSIDEFMTSFKKMGFLKYGHVDIFFHNLKFDGSFILNWLLRHKNHAITMNDTQIRFTKTKNMISGDFKYLVSDRGQFYSITYKLGHTVITFLDSVKLLPMKLQQIGEEFDTHHKKLSMDYEGFRYAGCNISDDEMEYIKNDVLVMTEALDVFINQEGYDKMTIGSNCLNEYIDLMGGKEAFYDIFPNLQEIILPSGESVDEYCRKSYKGAFCICWKPGIHKNGITADVNSEYPFVMKEFKHPYGSPLYHNAFDPVQTTEKTYVFVRVKCNFQLKSDKLPTIQIKNNPLYKGNEWLKTSYIYDENGIKYNEVIVGDRIIETRQELILCETDYKLFLMHYNVFDFEIVDWLEFPATKGLFDKYIDKYFHLKYVSEGGKRLIYKLFLNNLYGKLGTSPDSSFKIARLEDGVLKWHVVEENDKKTYHVACASSIIGAGRYWCITHAQANFENFCYADTDSLHLCCNKEDVKMLEFDKRELGKWDIEFEWEIAKFVRQKTYVEIQGKDVNLACCGMGEVAQKNVCYALGQGGIEEEEEKKLDFDFIAKGMTIDEFDKGLVVRGNLKSKQIKGGCILNEDVFELR